MAGGRFARGARTVTEIPGIEFVSHVVHLHLRQSRSKYRLFLVTLEGNCNFSYDHKVSQTFSDGNFAF